MYFMPHSTQDKVFNSKVGTEMKTNEEEIWKKTNSGGCLEWILFTWLSIVLSIK